MLQLDGTVETFGTVETCGLAVKITSLLLNYYRQGKHRMLRPELQGEDKNQLNDFSLC